LFVGGGVASPLHVISDATVNLATALFPKDIFESTLTWMAQFENSFFEGICGMEIDIGTCVGDGVVRGIAFVLYILAGIVMLKYYLRSLEILPTAVEAAAANFSASFMMSGLFGAILFGEWANRHVYGILLWIYGGMLIVTGVAVMSTAPSTTKVAAKED